MERPLLRFALLTLPLLLGLSSLAAIIVAPFAWGAGDEAGLAAWMPPATALAFGLPGLLIAERCVRRIRIRAASGFSLTPLLLFYGLLAMPVAILVLVVLTAGVTDAETFDRLRGTSNSPELSPAAYIGAMFAVAGLLNALLAAATANYVGAISEDGPGSHDRIEGEVDGVGELLSQRNPKL